MRCDARLKALERRQGLTAADPDQVQINTAVETVVKEALQDLPQINDAALENAKKLPEIIEALEILVLKGE